MENADACTLAQTSYALRSVLWYGIGGWLLLMSVSLVLGLTRDALRVGKRVQKRDDFSLLPVDRDSQT